MKVFQIVDGICRYDATALYPNAAEAAKHYSPDTVWVDAPDHVFEGWGYHETQEGNRIFTKPTPPKGWEYDPDTGRLLPSGQPTPEDDINAMLVDLELRLSLLEIGVERGED